MKVRNLGKKLLAVVIATVMMLGCVQTVFAYDMTDQDKAAFNISEDMISSKDSDGNVSKAGVMLAPASYSDMVGRFYSQIKKRKLFLVFGLSGVGPDREVVTVVDDYITSSTKLLVHQYNPNTGVWEGLFVEGIRNGKMSFDCSSNNPVAISVPESATLPDRPVPSPSKKDKITKLVINGDKKNIDPEEEIELNYEIVKYTGDLDNIDKTAVWSSKSKTIEFTPSNDGKTCKVTGLKAGSATVKVKVAGKTATYKLKVNKVRAEEVEIDSSNGQDLELGQSTTLTATVFPSIAYNKNVKWSIVSNKSTFGKKVGKVTRKKGTSCVVTINTKDVNAGDSIVVRAKSKYGTATAYKDFIIYVKGAM